MRFAKLVFRIAGIWGLFALTPLYFLYDRIGQSAPPPVTHPEFFYGFTAVGLAWQFGFLVIGWDPKRFRPMIIPAALEKFGYVFTLIVLCILGRIGPAQALPAIPDGILGVLFTIAFLKSR